MIGWGDGGYVAFIGSNPNKLIFLYIPLGCMEGVSARIGIGYLVQCRWQGLSKLRTEARRKNRPQVSAGRLASKCQHVEP